jgi:hypothetical protein
MDGKVEMPDPLRRACRSNCEAQVANPCASCEIYNALHGNLGRSPYTSVFVNSRPIVSVELWEEVAHASPFGLEDGWSMKFPCFLVWHREILNAGKG